MGEFIEKLNKYVHSDDNIDACLLMGSNSDEKQKRIDDYSDVDLFIITEKKDEYLNDARWLEFYHKVPLFFQDPISLGIGTELRVCFDNELLSDIAIVNYEEFTKLMQNDIFKTKIIGRGFKIIKNNYPIEIYNVDNNENNDNSFKINEEFLNRLRDEFYIDIYNVLKHYCREDYFTAFYAFERRISKIIIFILEESYKLDGTNDVMFNGRYFKKWLNEEDYRDIEKIFLNINKDDFLNSLTDVIDLFERKCNHISEVLKIDLERKEDSIQKIKGKIESGKGSIWNIS